MSGRTARAVLAEALAHFQLVVAYGTGDLEEQKTVDAICMRLSAGIETLAALTPRERDELFGNTWRQMWGMHNRIAHGYLLVERSIIRSTLQRDLPKMIDTVETALGNLP